MSNQWSMWPCSAHNHAKNNAPIATNDIRYCGLLADEPFAPCFRLVSDSWPILQPAQNIAKWNPCTSEPTSFDLKIWFTAPHVTDKHLVKFRAGLRLVTVSTAGAKHRKWQFKHLSTSSFGPYSWVPVSPCDGWTHGTERHNEHLEENQIIRHEAIFTQQLYMLGLFQVYIRHMPSDEHFRAWTLLEFHQKLRV